MHKTIEQLNTETVLNNEGKEKLFKTNLSDFDVWDPKVKAYALVHLKPGEEVQYHMHIGESETYFILSGKGIYNDDGNKIDISSGLVTFTPSGHGHGIKNTGDELLTFVALVVKCDD